LQDPLADLILAGKVHDGENLTVSADATGLLVNGEGARGRSSRFGDAPPVGALLN
jgi:hypothetical protein